MTDDMADLARRAVACKGWRRMPGMRYVAGGEAVRIVGPSEWPSNEPARGSCEAWQPGPESLPDLDDPATFGCLQHLAREAHSDPRLVSSPPWRGCATWEVETGPSDGMGQSVGSGATEAEAWVAALEVAT